MALDELQSLLHCGNPHPSPGPDGWGKWCVKALSDKALSALLHLVNYKIIYSTIPPFINHATLLTMHKQGLTTQLKNKHGIMLSISWHPCHLHGSVYALTNIMPHIHWFPRARLPPSRVSKDETSQASYHNYIIGLYVQGNPSWCSNMISRRVLIFLPQKASMMLSSHMAFPHRLPYWILLIKQMSNVEYALHMGTPTYLWSMVLPDRADPSLHSNLLSLWALVIVGLLTPLASLFNPLWLNEMSPILFLMPFHLRLQW